jgi:hypothetical protein
MTTQEDYKRLFEEKQSCLSRARLIPYIVASVIAAILIFTFISNARAEVNPPANLWRGLVAEDTSGNYQTYLAIASCVRNRLDKGMNTGLIALKRKNLNDFVNKEAAYMLKTKKLNLQTLTQQAINEVFANGKDTIFGADHYEHTGVYPTPKWAKNMKIVKVLYKGTKNEITFYKSRGA